MLYLTAREDYMTMPTIADHFQNRPIKLWERERCMYVCMYVCMYAIWRLQIYVGHEKRTFYVDLMYKFGYLYHMNSLYIFVSAVTM